jgi:hypothetical protein
MYSYSNHFQIFVPVLLTQPLNKSPDFLRVEILRYDRHRRPFEKYARMSLIMQCLLRVPVHHDTMTALLQPMHLTKKKVSNDKY